MKQQHGFTLIELLLYISLVSLLLGGLMAFFVMSTTVRVKNQSIMEVDQQGQLVVDAIGLAIRNADTITSPTTGTTGTSLTLANTTATQNPTIFNLSGTTLQIKEGTSAAVALTNSRVQVTNFSVKNLSRTGSYGGIQVTFTLSTINTTGRNEYDFQKAFTVSGSLR